MRHALSRWLNSDVGYSFRQSPTAMVAAGIAFLCLFCSVFAGWVSPTNPFDLATLELSDARLPPAWLEGGSSKFWLGTDDQGRDILSALIYGSRIFLVVGLASVVLSVVYLSPIHLSVRTRLRRRFYVLFFSKIEIEAMGAASA